MFSINVKGSPYPKKPSMVKLDLIFYQTGYNRVPKSINITGAYKDWDESTQSFSSKSSDLILKNKNLLDLKLKYQNVAEQWDSEGKSWTPLELAHYFDENKKKKPKKTKVSLVYQVIDILIETSKTKKRIKNGRIIIGSTNTKDYEMLKNSLSKFVKSQYDVNLSSISFDDIDEDFLRDYSLYLQQRGIENGNKGALVGRLKKLHAVCNYAYNKRLSDVDMSAFKCVEGKMQHGEFKSRAISSDIIHAIENIDRSKFSRIEQLHIDLFLFSFYAGGMGNIDVAFLNKNCISDGKFNYERMKFPKEARVPIINKAKAILNRYKDKCYGDYLLPIFNAKQITDKQLYEKVERMTLKVNKTLGKVQKEIKYKNKFTWYSARGSFITKMIDDGYNSFLVGKYAGNTSRTIDKHYYSVTHEETILQNMNNAF